MHVLTTGAFADSRQAEYCPSIPQSNLPEASLRIWRLHESILPNFEVEWGWMGNKERNSRGKYWDGNSGRFRARPVRTSHTCFASQWSQKSQQILTLPSTGHCPCICEGNFIQSLSTLCFTCIVNHYIMWIWHLDSDCQASSIQHFMFQDCSDWLSLYCPSIRSFLTH